MPVARPTSHRPSHPRSATRWLARSVALIALLVLAGACQVQVGVDTVVQKDGSGTVTVSVGLDTDAVDHLRGDPASEVRLDDLRQAGWTVTGPETGADGTTWIRASKPFASPEQMAAVLAEIAGDGTFLTDMAFTRTETDDDITYRVTGQVDLSKGVATFGEADVAALLGGDPFGGNVAAIESEQGRPISDMVTFTVTTSVAGGPPSTVTATLADTAPHPIDVSTVEVKPPSIVLRVVIAAAVVAALVLVVVALVGVRRRMRAH